MANPEEFIKKYHVAVARASKGRLDKVKPRIASEWVGEWMDEVDGSIADEQEFAPRFEQLLTEGLGLADDSKVSMVGDELVIDVGGCMICPGNDILKKAGEEALCPMTPTGLMAISRVMGKKATLEGVYKEGKPIGYYEIKYKLQEKGA